MLSTRRRLKRVFFRLLDRFDLLLLAYSAVAADSRFEAGTQVAFDGRAGLSEEGQRGLLQVDLLKIFDF